MPLNQGGILSDQEAYDVAAYFINQPRPEFARASEDWPAGGRPDDARY
jgi:thiosulfate dehydrogenase